MRCSLTVITEEVPGGLLIFIDLLFDWSGSSIADVMDVFSTFSALYDVKYLLGVSLGES